MTDTVISVENLCKSYLIGHQSAERERYASLRDVVVREARSYGRRFLDMARGRQIVHGDDVEEFWALKDVSFDVRRGEIVGVVGRNGAGKSTLLKILSRISEPTSGRVKIRGRVASLLEVGTGFHPELTGRENVYLNGAILGMTRQEINTKFDEIVDFAEVERFLDTPVKRYSSGMYVRLAFAVAAHLDPEVLLVDEVLAVGDAAFQKKCLGKIESVSTNEGRTVIFISHNTAALLSLCKRGILLQKGQVAAVGTINEIVQKYFLMGEHYTNIQFPPKSDGPSITGVSIDRDALKVGDLIVDVSFHSPFPLDPFVPQVVVNTVLGNPIYGSRPRLSNIPRATGRPMTGVVRYEAKQLPLSEGHYTISVWIGDSNKDYDYHWDVLSFEFRAPNGPVPTPGHEAIGHFTWPSQWTVQPDAS
jgi:lipopolysaccharide transport system ATP-binding protein